MPDVRLGFSLSNTSRRHVREAVGQLLDYAPHFANVTEMAVLLPERPDHQAIDDADRYGIEVIYRTSSGSFDKAQAPEEARTAILAMANTQQRPAPARQQGQGNSLRSDWPPSATRATADTTPATAQAARPSASTTLGVERTRRWLRVDHAGGNHPGPMCPPRSCRR